jgi:hypothetical protein
MVLNGRLPDPRVFSPTAPLSGTRWLRQGRIINCGGRERRAGTAAVLLVGTLTSFLLLNSLSADLGWRIGFLVGPVLAFAILFIRRNVAGRDPAETWPRAGSSERAAGG